MSPIESTNADPASAVSRRPPPGPEQPGNRRVGWMAIILGTFLAAAPPARAEVLADIVAIGYPFPNGWGYRQGAWTPVVVEIALLNQTAFDGRLRLQQPDRDGDFPVDEVEVHLIQANDSPAAPRRYTLYALAHPTGSADRDFVQVQLFSQTEDGQLGSVVEVISQGARERTLSIPQNLIEVGEDDLAILSVGEGMIGKIGQVGQRVLFNSYERTNRVAHIAPAGLPDRWQGLEMIDVIVWDDADPTRISDAQARALVEWAYQGGDLILAAGRTAGTLGDTQPFGSLLPVQIESVEAIDDLSTLRTKYLRSADVPEPELPSKLTIARCRARPGGHVILEETVGESTVPMPLISSRGLGRGRLVFIAASVRDLLSGPCDAVKFWNIVLGLRPLDPDSEQPIAALEPVFKRVEEAIGFSGTGGVYLTVALLFLVGYVGLSTGGVWWFLKSRGWSKHNWSAFAAVAVVATIVSLAAVQSTRGFGQKLEHITIVDGTAGDRFVRAIIYCGLRATMDTTLDVWIPDDYAMMNEPAETTCYLKPLPAVLSLDGQAGAYTDPTPYTVRPARAVLENVRLRATVKQLEARWFGELPGTILAKIRAEVPPLSDATDPANGTVSDEDWESSGEAASRSVRRMELRGTITNGLPFTLHNCLIFHALRDVYNQDFYIGGDRPKWIYVHRIGTLAADESFDLETLYLEAEAGGPLARIPFTEWSKHTLDARQSQWGRSWTSFLSKTQGASQIDFGGGVYQDVLLSATTASDARTFSGGMMGFGFGKTKISRAGLRGLDISDRIDRRTALLIGFADESPEHTGPVVLCTRSGSGRFTPVKPTRGLTLYRFLIPLIESSEDGG